MAIKSVPIIIAIIVCCLFFTCQRDPVEMTEAIPAELICDSVGTTVEGARFAISALVQERKIKLAEAPRCEVFTRERYAEFNIPSTVQGAVGGDENGRWTIVTWEQEGEELVFRLGTAEAGMARTAYYSELARYRKGQFTVSRPLHLADLAGYYSAETADTSYVLFLGLRGPFLIGKLFATPEAMPPGKMLQRALPSFSAGPDTPIECDLNRLRFDSSIGEGSFFWQTDSVTLHFNRFLGVERAVDFGLVKY